jgi:hypothetical protein
MFFDETSRRRNFGFFANGLNLGRRKRRNGGLQNLSLLPNEIFLEMKKKKRCRHFCRNDTRPNDAVPNDTTEHDAHQNGIMTLTLMTLLSMMLSIMTITLALMTLLSMMLSIMT